MWLSRANPYLWICDNNLCSTVHIIQPYRVLTMVWDANIMPCLSNFLSQLSNTLVF